MTNKKQESLWNNRWNSLKGLFSREHKSRPLPENSSENLAPPEALDLTTPPGQSELLKSLKDYQDKFGEMTDAALFESLLISAVSSFILSAVEPEHRTKDLSLFIVKNCTQFILKTKEDLALTSLLTRKQLRRKLEELSNRAIGQVDIKVETAKDVDSKHFDA